MAAFIYVDVLLFYSCLSSYASTKTELFDDVLISQRSNRLLYSSLFTDHLPPAPLPQGHDDDTRRVTGYYEQ